MTRWLLSFLYPAAPMQTGALPEIEALRKELRLLREEIEALRVELIRSGITQKKYPK